MVSSQQIFESLEIANKHGLNQAKTSHLKNTLFKLELLTKLHRLN